MKIWWCEEHQCSTDTFGTDCYKGRRADFQNCAMVEMRLISVDAVVIEKVDGEWPEWAINPVNEMSRRISKFVLDALAEAQK